MTDRESEYERKRDFNRTSEPRAGSASGGEARFVIQHHAASSEHYDFRLEADGTLKSWAVPKGPSTDPSEKRLALPTEDHPLEYADFEGSIPTGQYGAGEVVVWDRGTYENRSTGEQGEPIEVAEALAAGRLRFELDGEKLSGGYALTRIADGDDERWLLVKRDDEAADARRNPTSTEPESVISGKTVAELAEQDSE